jgi:hypothetical protein
MIKTQDNNVFFTASTIVMENKEDIKETTNNVEGETRPEFYY